MHYGSHTEQLSEEEKRKKDSVTHELSSAFLRMAFIISASRPRLPNYPNPAPPSASKQFLVCASGALAPAQPANWSSEEPCGRQPTQWWMEVHVALRKDFCSRGPHTLVPHVEKLRWGFGFKGGWPFPKNSCFFFSSPPIIQSHTLRKTINNQAEWNC